MTGPIERESQPPLAVKPLRKKPQASIGSSMYVVTLILVAVFSIVILLNTFGMVNRLATTDVSGHDIRHFRHTVGYLTITTLLILLVEAFFIYRPLARQRQEALDSLSENATTDPLTAILNRSAFLATLQSELLRGVRVEQPLCLLIAEIDRFHNLNDRFGAAAGDIVLKHFAASAQILLRAGDVLGRLGGEEFALLLPATDLHGGENVAERIRDSFAGTTAAVIPDGQRVTATVSFGVVCTLGVSPSEALEEADALLTRAKASGRNRIVGGTLFHAGVPAHLIHAVRETA